MSTSTLAVSLVALASPGLMRLLTRDLTQLRAGQWWRVVTPVLVQPDGWGQLVFNLLGIAVVGAALERRTSRSVWTLTYLLGGVGSIAVISAWRPLDTGGGSSNAVAALIGALTVLLAADSHVQSARDQHNHWSRADWPAQVYCVFFAAYPPGLELGGVGWSILAGNATIVAFFTVRRALSHTQLTRACLLLVGAAGVLMSADQDGHGLGILIGTGVALLVLLHHRARAARHLDGPLLRVTATVAGVWVLTILTWVCWVRLLGVDLIVATPNGDRHPVGWLSVSFVAVLSGLGGCAAVRVLQAGRRKGQLLPWTGLCLGATLVSLAGPLSEAVGPTSLAALISLHLVCGTSTFALARHTASPKAHKAV
ncbi:MAG: DUF6069 family protein [Nocardioidaceae bacterium]